MDKKSPDSENTAYDNNGSTPKELVKKHMLNRKHVVTENEMQHMNVGNDEEHEKELEDDIIEKAEEIENTPNRQAASSYDILGG